MEEALIKRVMPHDEEAESSVIGAMLIDNEAIMVASELITGEDSIRSRWESSMIPWWSSIMRENRWSR